MPRKRGKLICPVCKVTGHKDKNGFLVKRWVNRRIHIPNNDDKITSVSEAWKYAAKVCLRARQQMILYPPPPEYDNPGPFYEEFSAFSPYNSEEIKAFESRHLSTPAKNIKGKIKELHSQVRLTTETHGEDPFPCNKSPEKPTMHLKLPDNTGDITKLSVAWLYGAIVCLVLRDLSLNDIQFEGDMKRDFTDAIYTYFSLFVIGLRGRERSFFLEYLKIIEDTKSHGYRGAAVINATDTYYCRKCSKSKKGILVSMRRSKEDPLQ